MRKIIFIVAVVLLGIATGSCSYDECTYDALYYDAIRDCEHIDSTCYLSWFTNYQGNRVETLIPYIVIGENNSDYEEYEANVDVSYLNNEITHLSMKGYTYGQTVVHPVAIRYDLTFNSFKTSYWFDIKEMYCKYGEFPTLEPVFSIISIETEDLGIADEKDFAYARTKVNIMLNVTQGDMSFDVPKTVIVKEKRHPIVFSASVAPWKDAIETNVGI